MKKDTQYNGLFITGTDTGVGKTYIGSQLVALLHNKGINAVPRKPIESGCINNEGHLLPEDAHLYYEAAQTKFSLDDICRYRFEPAISPQRAARLVNKQVYLSDVTNACIKNITSSDYLIVEGAGGFYSPLCENGSNAELAKNLKLPVCLVAHDKLGCINHILLTAEAIKNQGLNLSLIILNQPNIEKNEAMDNFEDLNTIIDIPLFITQQNETLINNNNIELILTIILST